MSDRAEEPETAPAPRAATYLADVGAGLRRPYTGAWMVTFTDLVALMLAFFVLLFSMSTVERYKWQNLVRSLAGGMDSIQTREGGTPAREFQIDQDAPVPATDLDYLTPLIEQKLAAEPAISAVAVWRQAGRAVVSLPAGALFAGDDAVIAGRAGASVYAISRMIQTLDNRIEVHAHTARAAGADPHRRGWAVSLARASALAAALAKAGYRRGIVARGYGSARHEDDGPPKASGPAGDGAAFAERIDIVIHDDEPKGAR